MRVYGQPLAKGAGGARRGGRLLAMQGLRARMSDDCCQAKWAIWPPHNTQRCDLSIVTSFQIRSISLIVVYLFIQIAWRTPPVCTSLHAHFGTGFIENGLTTSSYEGLSFACVFNMSGLLVALIVTAWMPEHASILPALMLWDFFVLKDPCLHDARIYMCMEHK